MKTSLTPQHLKNIISQNPNGFTYCSIANRLLKPDDFSQDEYIVALQGFEYFIPHRGAPVEYLGHFLNSVIAAAPETGSIGGWLDTDRNVYILDVSLRIYGGLDFALEFAKLQGQKAIYHPATGKVINT